MKQAGDKLKKKVYALLIIGLLILAPAFIVSAFWADILPAEETVEIRVDIGAWIYGIRTYRPDLVIKKGDLIEHNGIVYTAIRAPQNDFEKNPERIRTSNNPVYAENTKEYRSFHRYIFGDLVMHNGRTYRWHGVSNHLPNSGSHAPGISSNWQVLQPQPGRPPPWFPYHIYLEGDEVSINFYDYRSKAQHSGAMPPITATSNGYWTWIRR